MIEPIDLSQFEETRHIDPPTCSEELARVRADAAKLAEAVQSQITFLRVLEKHPQMRADASKLRLEVEDWLRRYGAKYLAKQGREGK